MDVPIIIEFVDHKDQRYDTCGDWQEIRPPRPPKDAYEGQLAPPPHYKISVSRTHNWRSSVAVAVHELVEMVLCIDACISQAQVDTFDFDWEQRQNDPRVLPLYDEPGDDPHAPYYKQHQIATTVERILIEAFGLTWHKHNAILDDLGPCPPDVSARPTSRASHAPVASHALDCAPPHPRTPTRP